MIEDESSLRKRSRYESIQNSLFKTFISEDLVNFQELTAPRRVMSPRQANTRSFACLTYLDYLSMINTHGINLVL